MADPHFRRPWPLLTASVHLLLLPVSWTVCSGLYTASISVVERRELHGDGGATDEIDVCGGALGAEASAKLDEKPADVMVQGMPVGAASCRGEVGRIESDVSFGEFNRGPCRHALLPGGGGKGRDLDLQVVSLLLYG